MHEKPRPPRLPRWLPVALLAVPALAQASPYTLTFLPDIMDADRPALRIDASGAPHVVWHALEASPVLLRYATFDGSAWTTEDVDTVEIGNSTPSLALDQGVPVVVDTRLNWDQRCAERTGPGTWMIESTNTHGGGKGGVLAIDGTGTRHVVYGSGLYTVAVTRRPPLGTWQSTDVAPDLFTALYGAMGITFSSSGVPRICFQPLTGDLPPKLQYAEKVGDRWGNFELVATIADDAFASMATGPDGAATISALFGVQGVGLFHRDAPKAWSFEGIDAAGTGPTSLAWDAEGRAHVAYVKAGAIWQGIRPTNGEWVLEPVTAPGAGESDALPSLTLDPNGDASIAFVRTSPREGGGFDRRLGIAHDVKTLSADPDATTDLRALAIEWVAPQPVQGAGRIAIRLARPSNVRLEIVSVDGRRVASRALGALPAGSQTVAWEPGALAPGIYLLRAIGEGRAFATRRWVTL